jgi:capsular exopolysaccharide synthesis family protein
MGPSLQPVSPLSPAAHRSRAPAHAPGPPHLDEPPLDLRRYVAIFWKWKWISLVAFLVVASLVAYTTMSAPKVYQASSKVQINPRTPQVLTGIREVVELGTGTYWANKEFFSTQYEVIRSRLVAQRVVEREALARDLDFLGLAHIRDPEELAKARSAADPAGILMGRLRVSPVEGSHLARVDVEDGVPERARRLSIAVAHAYKDINLEIKVLETGKALTLLGQQKTDLRARLEEAEKRLVDFKQREQVLSLKLSDPQNAIGQDLGFSAGARSKIETDLINLRARAQQLEKPDPVRLRVEVRRLEASNRLVGSLTETIERLRQEESEVSVRPVDSQPLVSAHAARVKALEEEAAALRVRYLDSHPRVREVEEKLSLARKAYEAARVDIQKRQVDSVRLRLKLAQAALDDERALIRKEVGSKLQAERNELKRQIAEAEIARRGHAARQSDAKQRAQSLERSELLYKRLSREVEENRVAYQVITKRYKEVEIAKAIHNNNVAVLDEARGATLVRPRLMYSLAFAIGLGLFAGLGIVVLLNFFDRTIRSQDDLERLLGLNFLGVIPTVRDEGGVKVGIPELHVHAHPMSSVAELVRAVRTNIQFMSPDRPLKKLVITSGQPLEGKTTVSLSLGISMAQAGNRVLIVSSDMRRPRIHQPFGLHAKRGISSWIVGEASIDEILLPTEIPNLTLLPCGPIPPNPAEILQADKFHSLVAQLEGRFDRILFDSPPIGAVTDPLILAAMADGVILIAQAGVTTKELMRHALKKLRAVNAHVVGCVLNHVDLQSASYGGYYRKGYYRHGYYAADDAPKQS